MLLRAGYETIIVNSIGGFPINGEKLPSVLFMSSHRKQKKFIKYIDLSLELTISEYNKFTIVSIWLYGFIKKKFKITSTVKASTL